LGKRFDTISFANRRLRALGPNGYIYKILYIYNCVKIAPIIQTKTTIVMQLVWTHPHSPHKKS